MIVSGNGWIRIHSPVAVLTEAQIQTTINVLSMMLHATTLKRWEALCARP